MPSTALSGLAPESLSARWAGTAVPSAEPGPREDAMGRTERSMIVAVHGPGRWRSARIAANLASDRMVVMKYLITPSISSTRKLSATTVAPGLTMLDERPDTVQPLSRTRFTGLVGKSRCLGRVAPNGIRVF